MTTTLLNAKQIGKQLNRLMREFDEFYWAIAWGTQGPLAQLLLDNKEKISKLIVGISFSHTDPDLLKALKDSLVAKVYPDSDNGLFHPKIYYFESSNGKAAAIVGSANFTEGGTHSNNEAALLLEGNAGDELFKQIRLTIETWWNKGRTIDTGFLDVYQERYEANKKHREALEKQLDLPPVRRLRGTSLGKMSWKGYMGRLKQTNGQEMKDRLAVLDTVKQFFNKRNRFSNLSLTERRAISGRINKKKKFAKLTGDDWNWFGAMQPARELGRLLETNNKLLSKAMDCIPRTGVVAESDFAAFKKEFILALEKPDMKGYAIATRLLAMKRPDYFICVNKKNRLRLSTALGFAPTTLSLDNYWQRVIEPITATEWWNAPKPDGEAERYWQYRVAMLDALYYDPSA